VSENPPFSKRLLRSLRVIKGYPIRRRQKKVTVESASANNVEPEDSPRTLEILQLHQTRAASKIGAMLQWTPSIAPRDPLTCGSNHTLVVTTEGVASFGAGALFQLGHGGERDEVAPRIIQSFLGHDVALVAAGSCHSIVVTTRGDAYSFGYGQHGVLGHGTCAQQQLPKLIMGLLGVRVACASAGQAHSVVVTSTGDVYQFGRGRILGENGECKIEDFLEPRLVPGIEGLKIVSVSAGADHVVLISSTGAVFTFGHGEHGCLGHGNQDALAEPRRVAALAHLEITHAAAGAMHTLFVSSTGAAFSCGFGRNGRLGLGNDMQDCLTPARIDGLGDIVYSAAGEEHSAAVSSAGLLYTWGLAEDGRLGLGPLVCNKGQIVRCPARVQSVTTAELVACGDAHTAVVTGDGLLVTFGRGSHGRLGLGQNVEDVMSEPYVVKV